MTQLMKAAITKDSTREGCVKRGLQESAFYLSRSRAEYFLIIRFIMSISSSFESLLEEYLLISRFRTSIFSDLESLLAENFHIRRLYMLIFSGFVSSSFSVIKYGLRNTHYFEKRVNTLTQQVYPVRSQV